MEAWKQEFTKIRDNVHTGIKNSIRDVLN